MLTYWKPNPGSQSAFLNCPFFEALFHGTRAPGKTEALLMSFARYIGQFKDAWRGIIFRMTENELAEIIDRSHQLFYPMFRDKVKYNKHKMLWEWSTGEKLYFRRIARRSEYWLYHGHQYPFIGWDELTNWPSPDCYLAMMSCCRSSHKGVPKMVRATTNPYGPGHTWIKERFELDGDYWRTKVIELDNSNDPNYKRVAIYGHISENKKLMENNPRYASILIQSAVNPEMVKAWLEGDWNITAGGMFADVWKANINIVEPFIIPTSWRVNRSFDWGSSSPFSVGWWAESDGTNYIDYNGTEHSSIRGDLFRINEWYGHDKNKTNTGLNMLTRDICRGIKIREKEMQLYQRCLPGPADSSIFDTIDGRSIGQDMEILGVAWERANKSPGSRKQGWQQIRNMMKNAHEQPREQPGLFVFNHCKDFIRLMPTMPRCDNDLDDIDTNVEDHIADETRYRVHHPLRIFKIKRTVGL